MASKNCENQQPTVRIRVHSPECAPIHRHIDTAFTVKGETDYQVWAVTCQKLMAAMGIVHAPLVIGFLLDFINTLPTDLRKILASGVILGLGCEVIEEKDGSVMVKQVRRYEPLGPAEGGTGGLVVPGKGGLVLPK